MTVKLYLSLGIGSNLWSCIQIIKFIMISGKDNIVTEPATPAKPQKTGKDVIAKPETPAEPQNTGEDDLAKPETPTEPQKPRKPFFIIPEDERVLGMYDGITLAQVAPL